MNSGLRQRRRIVTTTPQNVATVASRFTNGVYKSIKQVLYIVRCILFNIGMCIIIGPGLCIYHAVEIVKKCMRPLELDITNMVFKFSQWDTPRLPLLRSPAISAPVIDAPRSAAVDSPRDATCLICLDVLTHPMIIPCENNHKFHATCLMSYVSHAVETHEDDVDIDIRCPTCRQPMSNWETYAGLSHIDFTPNTDITIDLYEEDPTYFSMNVVDRDTHKSASIPFTLMDVVHWRHNYLVLSHEYLNDLYGFGNWRIQIDSDDSD